jgi:hypothetical protein
MNAKERALEIYNHHLALASADGRGFRKTVMDQLMEETGCTLAAAATHYNNAKKAVPVEGLGRAPAPKGIRKPGASKGKSKELVPDEECFSVLELVTAESGAVAVGRCQSFLLQGDASETYDNKVNSWPNSNWVLIQGLGPISGESYKLTEGEKEIKRHNAVVKV